MNHEIVVQAWKDRRFRKTLSEDQLAALPQHPADLVDVSDIELEDVVGGEDLTLFSLCESLSLNCITTWVTGTCVLTTFGCKPKPTAIV